MKNRLPRLLKLGWLAAFGLTTGLVAPAWGQVKLPGQARHESIPRNDGESTYGKVGGDSKSGFFFKPLGAEPAVTLEAAGMVTFDGPGADSGAGFPPMRVLLGLDQQISGKLGTVDDQTIRLDDGPGGKVVSTARAGASALTQRPGEALVFQDGFESLDPMHWTHVGEPLIVDQPKLAGSKSLSLPAGGSAVTYRLAEPVASGRLELAFHDPGQTVAGQQWFVDLLFRGPNGDESVRLILDWGEESLAVQSSGNLSLAVQRLARKPGWHRLGARFGPQTELAVDGLELAHGKGAGGPLIEIRLANRSNGNGDPPKDAAVQFDDLRLVRLAEPVGGLEAAPQIDDVRLVDGDQVFGRIKGADAESVTLRVDNTEVALPWTEVASLAFRRVPEQGQPIEGLLVRLEWRSAPGNDPRDLDQVEGALLAVSDDSFTLATPYSGELTIPRDRLRKLKVLGSGRRIVLDSTSHHLGNNDTSKEPHVLDPPLPEAGFLDRTFTLDRVPEGSAAWLVLDVVQVVAENSLAFPGYVKKGELRTNAKINGKFVDYFNHHITTNNETPDRIRLPIPPGLLHAGENKLRIEQLGKAGEPEELDDIGILSIAIEFDSARP